jgi:hypothetical protein
MKFKEYLKEMANYIPIKSGLKHTLWFPFEDAEKHKSPRIKVDVDGNRIPVSIEEEPVILIKTNIKILKFKKISDWIIKNKEVLLQHWYNVIKYNDKYLMDNLKK